MSNSSSQQSEEILSQNEPLNSSEEEELAEKEAIVEEEFDPEHPEDLLAEPEKQELEDEEQEEGAEDIKSDEADSRDDEEDDSIVCPDDQVEMECSEHGFCVEYAKEVDAFLLRTLHAKTGPRERRAAIAEVLCDHFSRKQ
jgi:hypothetical protein